MNQENVDKSFLLRVIQPGIAGLMDGSVSTLAPIFAAAFATHESHVAFLIGVSAATGAGISMAFATGRGHPVVRGAIVGGMTFLGGILHTLPFLIARLATALTFAYLVVGIELITIAYIRYRYFKLNFFFSILQVVLGGALVILAGFLIGSS